MNRREFLSAAALLAVPLPTRDHTAAVHAALAPHHVFDRVRRGDTAVSKVNTKSGDPYRNSRSRKYNFLLDADRRGRL